MNVKFPVKCEDFIAEQERIVGRTLDKDEREVAIAYMEIANDVYEDACHGDYGAAKRANNIISRTMHEYSENAAVVQFCSAATVWFKIAVLRGRLDANTAGELPEAVVIERNRESKGA